MPNYYRPQTKLQEENVFTGACLSFCPRGRGDEYVSSDDCCDLGQNDTIGKIELNPSFVLSSVETNCKNDIQ